MPDQRLVLIDTSVLHELIGLDGPERQEVAATELLERQQDDQVFVIPVTTLIETGNAVARRRDRPAAERLVGIIRMAAADSPPWTIGRPTWDSGFLDELLGGDSTGSNLVDLLGDGRLGTGDVAILVERDRLRAGTAYTQFEVWTRENELRAHGGPG